MPIQIDSRNLYFPRLASSSPSSSPSSVNSNQSVSPSTGSQSTTSTVSFPSFNRDFASYSSSTLSFRADVHHNNQLIIDMFYSTSSFIVENLIKGTMFIFKLMIDSIPSQLINNHHNKITINSWFRIHSTLCPQTTRRLTNSRCPSNHTNRDMIVRNQNKLPDLIPINDKQRKNRPTIKSSTSSMIIEVATSLEHLSDQFDSFHRKKSTR